MPRVRLNERATAGMFLAIVMLLGVWGCFPLPPRRPLP